eukprot:2687277-Rhodomonas_salina.1
MRFEAHLDQYLRVCHVPYPEWCKTFQTANKGAPLACLKQAYWCYLTMQSDIYNSEMMVLTRSQKEICKYYQNQSGLFIRQWHRPALWQYGVNAGTNFVEGKLREANDFSFNDIAEACGTGSFMAEKIDLIIKEVQKSLDFSKENIRKIVAD